MGRRDLGYPRSGCIGSHQLRKRIERDGHAPGVIDLRDEADVSEIRRISAEKRPRPGKCLERGETFDDPVAIPFVLRRLVGSELAFRRDGHLNFQMQLAKQVDTVPLTRDYITDWERTNATTSRQSAPGRAA